MRKRTDLLYHGTTKHYLKEQVREFGRYQHVPTESLGPTYDNKRIQLANSPITGMRFARQRSLQYANSPILLIVKTKLISPEARFTWEPFLSCDFLEQDWYRVLDIKMKRDQVKEETWEELKGLEEEVLRL